MLMQAVTTVSLAFAASIFGTFAVTSKYAGEAKSAIAAEPTKVKLATTPEFRTAKPIDQSLVPRAKTTRLPLLGNARQIAPTLPSGPQVHTHQMKDTIAAESTATSELEVDSNPQLEMVLPLHGSVPLPHMRSAADVAWDLKHTRYNPSPTRIASASKQPYGHAVQVNWDTAGWFVDDDLFKKIDTNHDDVITRDEFAQAVRGGVGTEANAKLTKLEALKKAMDGDDTAALRSALDTALTAGVPKNLLDEAKAKLTKKKAGMATAEDVYWREKNTRYGASPTRIASASKQPYGHAVQVNWDTAGGTAGWFVDEDLFNKIDTNQDGAITRDEFAQAVRGGVGTEAKAKLAKLEALKKAMNGNDTAVLRSALDTALTAGVPKDYLDEAEAKLAKLKTAKA